MQYKQLVHHVLQVGIATLLYLLVDNMFSKSRLTPARIKVWLSLLCVMTAWTALILHMLISAQWVESATKQAVFSLNEELVKELCLVLGRAVVTDVMLFVGSSGREVLGPSPLPQYLGVLGHTLSTS